MTIYFATSNKRKVSIAQESVEPYGIKIKQIEIEFAESRSFDQKTIAIEKAKDAYEKLKKPVIVEDSGYYIDALGGFPATHIKFSLETIGVKNVLKMLEGKRNRRAEWRMTLAYAYKPNKCETFTFNEAGRISKELRATKRACQTDYWRIHVPTHHNPKGLALSELTGEDLERFDSYFKKNNQFKKFGKWLVANQ